MNILITGGLGFVGSNLVAEFISRQHKVFVLDNYFTGTKDNRHEGANYTFGETADIYNIYHDIKIDLIYHLGEYARVEQSFEDIDLVFKYNWNSIYQVLKLAKYLDAKLIYAGSSTKFGDDGTAKYTSPYAYTKHANSELVKTYCEWFDIKYAITYFYNVYGKNEIANGKYATVIAKFLEAKKLNQSATIVGTGKQRRNFTHIDDIIDGLVVVGFDGYGDGYGIGSAESYSIIDLANILRMKIEYIPQRKGNRESAPVLTDKTRGLGWKQKHNLQRYLEDQLKLILDQSS